MATKNNLHGIDNTKVKNAEGRIETLMRQIERIEEGGSPIGRFSRPGDLAALAKRQAAADKAAYSILQKMLGPLLQIDKQTGKAKSRRDDWR